MYEVLAAGYTLHGNLAEYIQHGHCEYDAEPEGSPF
jgi:hypothetical protein